MTIVCALHFADRSPAAIRVAAQHARSSGESVWLVEVASESESVTLGVEREAAELRRGGLTVNTAVAVGPPTRAIRQFCSAKRASLLVVGDAKQTFGPLMVGPLDRFADRVNVPVLIVRDSGPFETWSAGRPLRVMLALDRTRRSTAARAWIARLLAYGATQLVTSDPWSRDEGERQAEVALASPPSAARDSVRRRQVGPQLLRQAKAERADLVVLSAQRHSGPVGLQWSLSHELLALAPMSVACIPEPLAAPVIERHRDQGRLLEGVG